METLTLRVAELVVERQELRIRCASTASLERNRLQIARAQWELGLALIDRHLPEPAAQSAASRRLRRSLGSSRGADVCGTECPKHA